MQIYSKISFALMQSCTFGFMLLEICIQLEPLRHPREIKPIILSTGSQVDIDAPLNKFTEPCFTVRLTLFLKPLIARNNGNTPQHGIPIPNRANECH